MKKSKPQFKTVDFSERSSDDFRKYIKFLMTHQDKAFKERFEGMSDNEIEGELKKQLEKKITKWVDDDTKHYDTIYPEDTKYGRGYKMLVSGEGQRVIFYEIYKDEDDNLCAKVHKCPHSKDFRKDLEKENIEPIKNANPNLLLDLLDTEYGEAVDKLKPEEKLSEEFLKYYNSKKKMLEKRAETWKKPSGEKEESQKDNDSNTKEKAEEVTDPETGKKIKKVKHTGKRGGHFYINDKGDKIYPEEWKESLKDIRTLITESNIVSLSSYMTERLSS